MRSPRVVVQPPPSDCPARIPQVGEPVCVQTLIAQAPVETLHVPVLHGPPRLNMHGCDLLLDAPCQVVTIGHLRPVVPAEWINARTDTLDSLGRRVRQRRDATGAPGQAPAKSKAQMLDQDCLLALVLIFVSFSMPDSLARVVRQVNCCSHGLLYNKSLPLLIVICVVGRLASVPIFILAKNARN